MSETTKFKAEESPYGGWHVLRRNERRGGPFDIDSWTAIESHDEREDAERRVRELQDEDDA